MENRGSILLLISLIVLVVFGVLPKPVFAQFHTYWQVDYGDWSNSANWSRGLNGPPSVTNGGTAVISQDVPKVGTLRIGDDTGTSGVVQLTNGRFSSDHTWIGGLGEGSFIQTGGENISGELLLRDNSEYHLRGTGILHSYNQRIGYFGTSDFIQTGGTNYVYQNGGSTESQIAIGVGSTENSKGTYYLGSANGTGQIIEQLVPAGITVRFHEQAQGSFIGWGQVELTGTLINNGQIIADGYGVPYNYSLEPKSLLINNLIFRSCAVGS